MINVRDIREKDTCIANITCQHVYC